MDEVLNELSSQVIGAAIEVHRELGPGLLETAYQRALMYELGLRGLRAVAEVPIPVRYKGKEIASAYRADIVVEDSIIIELKATEQDNPLHWKQLYTYLRLAGKRLGILLNFNRDLMKEGIKRIVNDI